MAKLIFLAACFVALLALSSAFGYRTTITTTVVEEEKDDCRQQFQQQQQLYHCKMYLSQGSQSEQISLRSIRNPRQQEEHLDDCCQQLRNMSERCRCQAIKQVVQQQEQQGGKYQTREMEEILQKAENLPSKCDVEPKQCQIRAVFF
ncbi:2S seed storage protein 5 [Abeliophyllum distichum]|uniref:2S seed storage protein 5 n=1 Tax=Abeliophyllum distichum TaxID=126358 RepID=A0ABD1UGH3_9LAMI